jgi:pimeloyl-ACP methyl ester carboxylesterase
MANFLLVHGAWHGAWCWRDVLHGLIKAGHRAHAVTLTGVGERAHLLTRDITLQMHISDVQAALEAEELAPVILVVHSYGGMLGTAVANLQPERIRHIVYVDAVLPASGESWSSTHVPATRDARIAAGEASPTRSMPPSDASVFGLTGEAAAWVQRRQTPHPAQPYGATLSFDEARVGTLPRTFISCTQPALATIDISRQRAVDPKFWGGHWLPRSQVVNLATGHDPMISEPAALTTILLGIAAG